MCTETQWRLWLLNTARRWVSCHEDAEDVVQCVLVRFWRSTGVLPWEHPDAQTAKNFCLRLVHEAVVDVLRARNRQPLTTSLELFPQDAVFHDPWDALLERVHAGLQIRTLFVSLSAVQQKVLTLLSKGYTHCEIADALGMGVGTVKRHLERIRQKAAVLMSTKTGISSELKGRGGNDANLSQRLEDERPPSNRHSRGGGRARLISRTQATGVRDGLWRWDLA